MKYWIERWVQLRKKELISYPHDFPIHDAYKTICTKEELKSGFKELHEIFARCYEDIINAPADMLLPIYDMNGYAPFSKEEKLSREESYKYAKVFYALGYSGELKQNGELRVEVNKLKEQCKALKITNINAFLNVLGSNYGLVTEGLVNGKLKSNTDIVVSFPDNKNVIAALYIMAVKANKTNRFKDFCRLNYRLFESDWDAIEYDCVEAVSDLFHSERDRAVAQLIHKELLKRKYCYNFQDWNEGPQIRYYKSEGDRNRNTNAGFWIASMDTEFRFYFRIKNMDRVLEYIESCPESVVNNFMVSDNGCANRIAGTCVSGISYRLNDKTIWRCGCCNPNFQVTPNAEDFMFYIDAVELSGSKKK